MAKKDKFEIELSQNDTFDEQQSKQQYPFNGSNLNSSQTAFSELPTVTEQLKQLEKSIKLSKKNGKESREIIEKMILYSKISNENIQKLDMGDSSGLKQALQILQKCIQLLEEINDEKNELNEQQYETLNNLARCYNFQGNIRVSLTYLLKAYTQVQRIQSKQEAGTVTIMPELSLNICNAYIYENDNSEALQYANKSLKSSSQCLIFLKKKIKAISNKQDDIFAASEINRLKQMYISQITLQIQAFQAKGKIYEKLNKFREAIRQYNLAKEIIEKKFGTNHILFKEVVNQVSAANIIIKSKSYQGVSRQSSKLHLRENSLKKLKENKSPEKYVQFSEDTIDIRSVGGESDFCNNSIMSDRSVRTEDHELNQKSLISGLKKRRLQSARKSSQEMRKKSKNSSRSKRLKYQGQYSQMIQPTITGLPFASLNPLREGKKIIRNGELINFKNYYGPKVYDSFNLHRNQDRPLSFYQTLFQLENSRRRPKSQIKKIIYRKTKKENQPLPQIQVQQQIEQSSQNDEKLEEYIKDVQIKQFEQKQKIIVEMENQKMQIIEYQRQERERAKQEREAFIQELAILTTKIQQKVIKINQQKIKIELPEPEVQVPPVHPTLGPAVYDYINLIWVYPYSQWYGGEIPKGKEIIEEVEDIVVIEQLKPLPETVDRGIQEVEPIIPKPTYQTQEIQTLELERDDIEEQQTQTENIQIQTTFAQTDQIIKREINLHKPNLELIQFRAAQLIQQQFKIRILRIREQHFYKSDYGILLTRKRRYNKINESFEIMSMYVIPSLENRCQSLRFTLFNYKTKNLVYTGTYTKMLYLNEFDVYKLKELSKSSLDLIQFEVSQFRYHLLCLQSVINTSRIQKKPMKEVVIIDEKQEEEEEVVIVQKPGMKNFTMQKDNKNPEWELVNDDEGYIMYPSQMHKKDLRKRKELQKNDFIGYIKRIQKWWKNQRIRYAILRYIKALNMNRQSCCIIKRSIKFGKYLRIFTIQLYKVNKKKFDKASNSVQEEIIYELIAREVIEKNNDQDIQEIYQFQARKKVHYHNLRLPEDPETLKNYVKDAAVLELDPKTGKIKNLKLLRIMIKPKPQPEVGCFVKAEFPLINYKNHICRIYKRFRWEILDKNKQIVTDWKIKVIQKDEPQSDDYIVVRKLPCKLDDIQQYIQNTLTVIPNRRVIPNSILHLNWKVKGIQINSQKYYDLNSSRLKHEHHSTWYITQYPRLNVRIPNENDISRKNWGSFYEIYIQKMIPKIKENKPVRYRTKEYLQLKEQKREEKYGEYRHIRRQGSPSSSESEDDNSNLKYEDPSAQIFWDEKQLIRMQLDEVTEAREYYKITVTRTSDKQDTDYFRIEKDIVKWPHPDLEYQYITENLSIKQIKNEVTNDFNIEVTGLRIRNNEQRFVSDEAWLNSLTESDPELIEQFMAQDETRWQNQNFASTVYNAEALGGGFLVEVINIDKPVQRAYKRLKTLVGMRGLELKFFIDEKLRIIGTGQPVENQQKNQLQQAGFSDEEIIKSIEFECTPEEFKEKLQKNQNYLQDRKEAGKKPEPLQEEKIENILVDNKQLKKATAGIWAKFNIFTYVDFINTKKKLEIMIEVKRYVNPAYFKITIVNTLNQIQNDTVVIKLLRLPDPLKAHDKDLAKIKEVFQQKLKIEWLNPRMWMNQKVPLMQDAFIDNSYVKEEVIHKIVEVKEWNKYYKKVGEIDSSESDEQEILQLEQQEIQQDIIKLKEYIDQINKYLKNENGGIEQWFKKYDQDGVDLQKFNRILYDIQIKIEGRLAIMLYIVFDRSYTGKFTLRDFEDIMLKRIQVNFKKIVFQERQRFKLHGEKIVFQKKFN